MRLVSGSGRGGCVYLLRPAIFENSISLTPRAIHVLMGKDTVICCGQQKPAGHARRRHGVVRSNPIMIEFQDVSVVHDDGTAALSHLSLRIAKGEFICVVGPTGAGKSTFLKLIYQAAAPTRGQVIVDGEDLSALPPRDRSSRRRRMGIVCPDYGLLPDKTLFENIALPLRMSGAGRRVIEKKVSALLELLDLTPRADALARQISAGEQLLAQMARALVHKPAILLADAPTGCLDSDTSMRVARLLAHVNQYGTTIVVATNDRQMVAAARRRILALEQGCLVSDTRGESLSEEPVAAEMGPVAVAPLSPMGVTPADPGVWGLSLRVHRTSEPVIEDLSLQIPQTAARSEPTPVERPLAGPTYRGRPPVRAVFFEAAGNIRRHGMMSLAALLTVTLSVTVLAGALIALGRLRQVTSDLPRHFEVTAFLRDDLPAEEMERLQQRLAERPDVAEVRLVSREEAWARMTEAERANGNRLSDVLGGENPLPDRMDIRVKDASQTGALADHLGTLEEVYKVRDDREALDRVLAGLQLARGLCGGTALILFLATVLVIRNTLRARVLARLSEIRILRSVGAPPSYLRLPLVLEGLFYGLFGGGAASALVLLLIYRLSDYVRDSLAPVLDNLPPVAGPGLLVFMGLGIGTLVGIMGSTLSIRYFLRRDGL